MPYSKSDNNLGSIQKTPVANRCWQQEFLTNKNEGNVINAPLTKTIQFFDYIISICTLSKIVNSFLQESKGCAYQLIPSKKSHIAYHSAMCKAFQRFQSLFSKRL